MRVQDFISGLNTVNGGEFFSGVPDSLLQPLCNYLMREYGISDKHIIAANEGNSVALAAGYHMATGKIPVVYMQNSGIGNAVNPVASLLSDRVYGIPCIFVVGWRGEPNTKDEPQHIFQGEITVELLEDVGIHTQVIDKTTTVAQLSTCLSDFQPLLEQGKSIAFIIKKNALEYDESPVYSNGSSMLREEIISRIADASKGGIIISTTGKASRELFEIRERNNQSHRSDFLTVGSMGHSSSIALSIALNKPNTKVWCIDGDGALLMHMGAMPIIGANRPNNLIHIVINNGAHETVGGLPTVIDSVDLPRLAESCGYPTVLHAEDYEGLESALLKAKNTDELTFVEVKASMGARQNLGRPTTSAMENKVNFINYLKEKH